MRFALRSGPQRQMSAPMIPTAPFPLHRSLSVFEDIDAAIGQVEEQMKEMSKLHSLLIRVRSGMPMPINTPPWFPNSPAPYLYPGARRDMPPPTPPAASTLIAASTSVLPTPPPVIAPAPVSPPVIIPPAPAPPAPVSIETKLAEDTPEDDIPDAEINYQFDDNFRRLFSNGANDKDPIAHVDAEYVKNIDPEFMVAYVKEKYHNPLNYKKWSFVWHVYCKDDVQIARWRSVRENVRIHKIMNPQDAAEEISRQAKIDPGRLVVYVGVPSLDFIHVTSAPKNDKGHFDFDKKQWIDVYVHEQEELDAFKNRSGGFSFFRPVQMKFDNRYFVYI